MSQFHKLYSVNDVEVQWLEFFAIGYIIEFVKVDGLNTCLSNYGFEINQRQGKSVIYMYWTIIFNFFLYLFKSSVNSWGV